MMIGAQPTAKVFDVARFRMRLNELLQERSISQRQLARDSGVSLSTVSRLATKDFDRIDADTLYTLLDFFQCKFEDLIERVTDN